MYKYQRFVFQYSTSVPFTTVWYVPAVDGANAAEAVEAAASGDGSTGRAGGVHLQPL